MKLTVQPTGKKIDYNKYKYYRLGIKTEDSKKYFGRRGVEVNLILGNGIEISSRTSCGVENFDSCDEKVRKKGYDLNDIGLSKWIVEKGFHSYNRGNPTELLFEFDKAIIPIRLVFIENK